LFVYSSSISTFGEFKERKNQMNWKKLCILVVFVAAAMNMNAQVPVTAEINVPNMGKKITPLAQRGSRYAYLNPGLATLPNYVAGQALHSVVSPDHKTLLIVTSGYNAGNNSAGTRVTNNEWVFIFDVTNPIPVQKQAINVANTYNGIVFDPSGTTFYVTGGVNDNVHIYDFNGSAWAERLPAVALSHTSQSGGVSPVATGIDVTKNGLKMIVTNYENDSVTLLNKNATTGAWSKGADFDLRPGKINTADKGVPGGAFPFWVTIKDNTTAYVSSIRDREIDVLDISGTTPTLVKRIKLTGQPLKSILNADQSALYVAEDQTDSVALINTNTNSLTLETKVAAPTGVLSSALTSLNTGQNTNSVALSPDETKLYVTNGNTNNVAVLNLPLSGGTVNNVIGLIPTAMYPTNVNFSADGKYMYVINSKSPSGPNAGYCRGGSVALPNLTAAGCAASNGYSEQTIKAGLQFLPTPTSSQLTMLTQQVAANNNYSQTEDPGTKATMDFLNTQIKHIVYIIKENRTYDQILGDLPFGNGSPALAEFPASVTPNYHRIATNFVTLDNFYDASEVSYDGWAWSTAGYVPDVIIRQTPVNYSPHSALSYDSEGDNRNINLVARTGTNASDQDVLPGLTNFAAPDGPNNQVNTGYIWDSVLRAGLTVRNYGFFCDNIGSAIPNAFASGIVQVRPANPALAPLTDLYFRGYDQNQADFYLYQEWAREFDLYVANGGFPSLNLVRLPHDHTGNFGTALSAVNTPELQEADNDYAVALLIDKISKSPYASSTLVFVIEDDAQNGGDHVDVHRSTAYIVGPYVKKHVVVSTQYNTINFIRTMERILGGAPVNLNDAVAQPMADVFDMGQSATWSFQASPATILYNTTLPLPPPTAGLKIPKSTHDAAYWAKVTKGFNLAEADAVEPEMYNRVLWEGLKGKQPYPGDPNLATTKQKYREAQKTLASSIRFDDDDDDDK
jgi:DNA-binding beta-propeller fold protein YncE